MPIDLDPVPRFRTTYETGRLVELLAAMSEGQLLLYEVFTNACGADVTARARPWLNSARKIAERDYGTVTQAVSKLGIRRCTNAEIGPLLEATLVQANRKVKRGVTTALRTDIERLDNSEKEHLAGTLQRATLATLAFDPRQTAVSAARTVLDQTSVPLAIADDLKRLMEFNAKKR